MTDKREPEGDRSVTAGERALGLLTDAELGSSASDPQFAGELARWRGYLAPLFAEVEPVNPPAELWSRIAGATAGTQGVSNVVQLRRRVGMWRGATAGMTALAASLALILAVQPREALPPPQTQTQRPTTPPMVAMLGDGQKDMKVMATWDPAAQQLVLALADEMPADAGHSHELWVIPAGGKPRSLGTMPARNQMHMRIADTLAQLLQQGATIAISVEPAGGSPTGAPTGPVVAAGALAPT